MKSKPFFFAAIVGLTMALCMYFLPFPRMFDLTMNAVEILPNGDAVDTDAVTISGWFRDYRVRSDELRFTSVTVMGRTASAASGHMPALPLRTDTPESGYYQTNTSFYLMEDRAVVNVDITLDIDFLWWILEITDQLGNTRLIVASTSGDFSTPLKILENMESVYTVEHSSR